MEVVVGKRNKREIVEKCSCGPYLQDKEVVEITSQGIKFRCRRCRKPV